MTNRAVYLVRSGKISQPDNQRRYIGQTDWPLCAAGIQQAQLLQRLLERVELQAVYCSDLARSLQTAKIVAENKTIDIRPLQELREIAMGEWEGRTYAEIAQRFPDHFQARANDAAYYRTPGGESFAECARRVLKAFQSVLAKTTGNILIVGHAGTNRVLLCHALGLPLANLYRIGQNYGCLNVINCTPSGYQLKLMNFTRG